MLLAIYASAFIGILETDSMLVAVLLSLAQGLFVGLLFIAGHDACHGALTPRKWLNGVLGRVAFLPSLHPFVAWQHSHNAMHHSWTNLRGKDPVYAPLTLQEYRRLSPFGRLRERFERSIAGMGLLYLRRIWLHEQILPREFLLARPSARPAFLADLMLVLVFAATLVLAVVWIPWSGVVDTTAERLLWAVIVPFLVWNWLMGFVTYQHHTHPEIPWFDDQREWAQAQPQQHCTLHVVLPQWADRILLRIMQHPAHHIDPAIPLYRLKKCQEAIADHTRQAVWDPRECLRVFSTCKLYDFSRHTWLDYTGREVATASRRVTHSQPSAAVGGTAL